jgi:hypothetical protein
MKFLMIWLATSVFFVALQGCIYAWDEYKAQQHAPERLAAIPEIDDLPGGEDVQTRAW